MQIWESGRGEPDEWGLGQADAVDSRAAKSNAIHDLPSPGSPSNNVILPKARYPGQSQSIGRGVRVEAARASIGLN